MLPTDLERSVSMVLHRLAVLLVSPMLLAPALGATAAAGSGRAGLSALRRWELPGARRGQAEGQEGDRCQLWGSGHDSCHSGSSDAARVRSAAGRRTDEGDRSRHDWPWW